MDQLLLNVKTDGEDNTNKNAFAGFSFGSLSSGSESGFKLPTFSFNPAPQAEVTVETGPEMLDSTDKEKPKCLSATSPSTTEIVEPVSSMNKDDEPTSRNVSAPSTSTSVSSGDFKEPKLPPTILKKSETPEEAYLKQMMHLNECFVKWITENVRKSPDCILTPCLEDYNKYVAKIDENYPESDPSKKLANPFSQKLPPKNNGGVVAPDNKESENNQQSDNTSQKAFDKPQNRIPTFGVLTNTLLPSAAADPNPASKKSDAIVSPVTTAPKFTFGTGSGVPFSFGTGSSFPTFGQGFFSKTAEGKIEGGESAQAGADDEEYEPPKSEVVETNEDGAFYSVRYC